MLFFALIVDTMFSLLETYPWNQAATLYIHATATSDNILDWSR